MYSDPLGCFYSPSAEDVIDETAHVIIHASPLKAPVTALSAVNRIPSGTEQVVQTQQEVTGTEGGESFSNISGLVGTVVSGVIGPLIVVDNYFYRLPAALANQKLVHAELSQSTSSPRLDKLTKIAAQTSLEVQNRRVALGSGILLTATFILSVLTIIYEKMEPLLTILEPLLSVLGGLTGAALIWRGGVVFTHGFRGQLYANELHEEFAGELKRGVDQAFAYIESMEKETPEYFKQMVDHSFLPNKERFDLSTQAGKLEYLKCVDKGMHAKRLKHKIWMVMGTAWGVAGSAMAIANFLTCGIPGIAFQAVSYAIGAAVSAGLLAASPAFIADDWVYGFNWLQSKCYEETGVLQELALKIADSEGNSSPTGSVSNA